MNLEKRSEERSRKAVSPIDQNSNIRKKTSDEGPNQRPGKENLEHPKPAIIKLSRDLAASGPAIQAASSIHDAIIATYRKEISNY